MSVLTVTFKIPSTYRLANDYEGFCSWGLGEEEFVLLRNMAHNLLYVAGTEAFPGNGGVRLEQFGHKSSRGGCFNLRPVKSWKLKRCVICGGERHPGLWSTVIATGVHKETIGTINGFQKEGRLVVAFG